MTNLWSTEIRIGPLHFQARCQRWLNLALVFCVIFVFLVYCVSSILGLLLFYVVSTSAVDCLERLSPKWPIMCREGRWATAHMVTLQNRLDPTYQTCNQHHCQGDYQLPSTASSFFLYSRDGSTSSGTRCKQIPNRITTITTESIVHCFHHHITGEDVKGAEVPRGWG